MQENISKAVTPDPAVGDLLSDQTGWVGNWMHVHGPAEVMSWAVLAGTYLGTLELLRSR